MPENTIELHNHNNDESFIFDKMPSNDNFQNIADAMKQLGDPSRLKIFWILCHNKECVQNIAIITKMSSPAVSHHLRILKSAKLITSERVGKEVIYTAVKSNIVDELHIAMEKIAKVTCKL